MEQEFTISKGYRVFNSIASVLLIFTGIFFLEMSSRNEQQIQIIVIAILMFTGGILILINQYKAKIIISNDSIRRINVFKNSEMLFADIKGIRIISTKVISIESKSGCKIRIKNYLEFGNIEQLVNYLKSNFRDLTTEDSKKELDKALANEHWGTSATEREASIKKARVIAWTYNITGLILGFFVIFFQNAFISFWLTATFPVLGILIMPFSKGLIKFLSDNLRSVYSFIGLGFFMPAFVMMIKSLADYEIAQYLGVWLPFFSVSFTVLALLYFIGVNRAAKSISGQVVVMLIIGFVYGYGITIQINCVFDKSTPQLTHTTVYNKWIEHSKGAHYHLRLTSWDLNPKPKDIEVSWSTYNKYADGDKIDVDLKKGVLNVPWYYLAE